ncbi:hypothetical protein BpHYR1_029228, partial [Brachionus plicatilis]
SKLLFVNVQVAHERPAVWLGLREAQRFLEPLASLVNLAAVPAHAADAQDAINVLRVPGQYVPVALLGQVVLVSGFVEPGHVVLNCGLDGRVVDLVVDELVVDETQRRLKVPLGLVVVGHAKVERGHVVEQLGRHSLLHIVVEDFDGYAVGVERAVHVVRLEQLGVLYPGLDVVRTQLGHLFEVALGHFFFLRLLAARVDGAQDFHGLGRVLRVAAVQVHLAEAEKGKNEAGRVELGGLVVVLERLVVVALHVIRPGQLVACLGADQLVLGVVEGVHGQLLHFLIFFLVEEVIGQVVENDGIFGVELVGLGQEIDAEFGGLGRLVVELDDGEADESGHTFAVDLESALERQLGLGHLGQLVKAQAHAEANAGGRVRVRLQRFLVIVQRGLVVLFVEGYGRFADQGGHVVRVGAEHKVELGVCLVQLVRVEQTKVGPAEQVVRVVHGYFVGRRVQHGRLRAVVFFELFVLFFVGHLDVVGGQRVQRLQAVFFEAAVVCVGAGARRL